MAVSAKVGEPKLLQFSVTGPDGFTRVVGLDPSELTVELWIDDGAGNRVQSAQAVPIFALDPAVGEYAARVTPAVALDHYLVVRHPPTFSDWAEHIEVSAADIDDVKAAVDQIAAGVAAGTYLVGLEGGPWAAGQALQVTLTFRNANTRDLFNPAAVRRIELLSTDAATVLQAKEAGDIENLGVGRRRVLFAALANAGTYYLRIYFTGVAGEGETFSVQAASVLAAGGNVIAGVISVEDLLADYLAVAVDDDPQVALLKGPNGEDLVPVRFIQRAIRTNAVAVERLLETDFAVKRYACRPDLGDVPLVKGEDYDVEEDAYPWLGQRTTLRSGKITLRHVPLVRVNRVRMIYGSRVLYSIPTSWITAERRTGTLEIVLDGTGTFEQKEQVAVTLVALGDFLGDAISRNVIPNFWAIDYEAGLGEVPDDLVDTVAWRAIAEVLGLAAVKANKLAVQSQSLSMDGVSRSQSVSDSQPGGRFSRVLSLPHIQKHLDDEWVRKTLRPLVRASVRVL